MPISDIEQLYKAFLSSSGVCTDTRNITPGCLFIALKGSNFNGNRFAAEALEKGAVAVVIDEKDAFIDGRTLLTADALAALQELGKHHRKQFTIPVLGITGSNGKTTSKELIREVLSKKYSLIATEGNLNNHIGVPLTLLRINSKTEFAIIEMGANHKMEIGFLCNLADPDFGIITNIGKAHLGEFGGFEAVIQTKKELYDHIRIKNGKVFVNADDQLLMDLSRDIERVTYGTTSGCMVEGRLTQSQPFVGFRSGEVEVNSKMIGTYNFSNMLAAVAIGKYFGVSDPQIKNALESYTPSNNRSQLVKTAKGNLLIMDAYNANPSSMAAAIEHFGASAEGEKSVILGDMRELGEYEVDEHKSILELVDKFSFARAIFVGSVFKKAGSQLEFRKIKPEYAESAEELIASMKSGKISSPKGSILLKGSRGIQLEKIQPYL